MYHRQWPDLVVGGVESLQVKEQAQGAYDVGSVLETGNHSSSDGYG